MADVTKSDHKKSRGRPPIGRGIQVNIVMRPELIEKLDTYCKHSGKNRSSAIRGILEFFLQAKM